MKKIRLITLIAMVCVISRTLAKPVYSLKANGKSVPVIEFDGKYDYAVLSASGACNLNVTRLDGKTIEHCSISPLKLKLDGRITNATLSFSISEPRYLIVDIDNLRKLVIAIDRPETDKPAATGAGIFNVKDFGGDVQRAAKEAAKSGGIVYVPDGLHTLPELELSSNVSLYLEPNAILRCDGKRDDFKVRYHKKSRGRDGTWFIYTTPGASNVRIFGRGTIDGNGRQIVKETNIMTDLVVPVNCTDFVLDGPVLRDSGLWGVILAGCQNATIRNTKHFNHL